MAKTSISVEEMMEAGMHFGHQTHRRNPKMDPYIFDARSGIHVIDLTKTEALLKKALDFLSSVAADDKQVILVGTKRQAAQLVKRYAEKCEMPYVDERWLGGLLTNYNTLKKRIDYLKKLDERFEKNSFAGVTKKEKVVMDKERASLETSIGGVKNLKGLPGAVFVVDVIKDKIAVLEARKLHIPVVALADTNTDPDLVDYIIPANDDASRAIEYVLKLVAEACATKPKSSGKKVDKADEKTVEAEDTKTKDEE